MGLPATRPRRYQKSGLYCRPTRLADLPPEVAAARKERRDASVAQLGGPDEVSVRRHASTESSCMAALTTRSISCACAARNLVVVLTLQFL